MSTTNPTSYGISPRASAARGVECRPVPLRAHRSVCQQRLRVRRISEDLAGPGSARRAVRVPAGGAAAANVSAAHRSRLCHQSRSRFIPRAAAAVTLQSPDPHVPPAIDPALLSVDEDIQPLIRAIRLARRILAAPNFARYHGTELAPGAAVQSDAEIAGFHPRQLLHRPSSGRNLPHGRASRRPWWIRSCDCAVSRACGSSDASVMPRIIGGNTNAVVVMIAEKAADLIRQRPAARTRSGDLMAIEHMKTWKVGRVEITRLVEVWKWEDDIWMVLEDSKPSIVASQPWLLPHHVTPEGRMFINFQAFVVQGRQPAHHDRHLHRRRPRAAVPGLHPHAHHLHGGSGLDWGSHPTISTRCCARICTSITWAGTRIWWMAAGCRPSPRRATSSAARNMITGRCCARPVAITASTT